MLNIVVVIENIAGVSVSVLMMGDQIYKITRW